MITNKVETIFTEINDDIDLIQKMVTETKEKIMDNEDKLKLINNIIMYNVEESKSDITSDRNVDSMQFCSSDMKQVLRIGCKKGDTVNPRTTEGGGYHPPPCFSHFQKRFCIPLIYSLPHLLVHKFQENFALR